MAQGTSSVGAYYISSVSHPAKSRISSKITDFYLVPNVAIQNDGNLHNNRVLLDAMIHTLTHGAH